MSLLVPSLLESKLREFGECSLAYQTAFNARKEDPKNQARYYELKAWFKEIGYDAAGDTGLYYLVQRLDSKPIYCHILGSETCVLNEAIRKIAKIKKLGNKLLDSEEIEILADLILWFKSEGMSIHTQRDGEWVAKCGAAYGKAGNEVVLTTEDWFTPYTAEFFKSADEAPYLRYQDGRD